MRAHWLQHVAYEGLGHLEDRLARAGAEVTCTRLFAGDPLPEPDGIDLLVILGGPMSVNDDATLPWLAAEKAFIARVIDRGVAVLGICLGAQLIASVMGATVGPSPEREVGWWPVTAVPPPATHGGPPLFPFPPQLTCLQWHGETFGLPAGSVHLARSEGCEHQAMQIGSRVIGLQFHPEATPDWVQGVLAHSPESLRPGPFVMTEHALTADLSERCRAGHLLLDDLLDFLWTSS